MIKLLRIVTPSANTQITSLSGGNHQKCIVEKCLYVDSDILIFNEPTRGIDVGAKEEMYKIIKNLVKQRKSDWALSPLYRLLAYPQSPPYL